MSDQYPSYPSYPGDEPSTPQPSQQPAGQQPGGMPGPMPGGEAGPGHGAPVSSKRPGSVTAASIISIVLSALTVLSGVALAAASGPLSDYLNDNPDVLEGVSSSDQQDVLDVIDAALVGTGVVTVLIGVIGIVLGVLVLKPRPWARILLTIGAGLSILLGLLMSLNLVGLPWLAGAIAVIVLLFQGRASDWFAGRPQRS
jgi:hypothetical protein